MRISDWSSDVCSSDLRLDQQRLKLGAVDAGEIAEMAARDAEVEDQGIAAEIPVGRGLGRRDEDAARTFHEILGAEADVAGDRRMIGLHHHADDEIVDRIEPDTVARRPEEHTYDLQSLMHNSHAV